MDHRDALDLLRNAPLAIGVQRWADLGCGTGTFTRALGELLPSGSSIAAMDRDASALEQVQQEFEGTRITKHLGDFMTEPLPGAELDGILLANALHFVRDPSNFIRRISTSLKPTGAFLLVEYDTDSPNPWVPYPLSFTTLQRSFIDSGLGKVTRLADRASVFGRSRLYSAWVEAEGSE